MATKILSAHVPVTNWPLESPLLYNEHISLFHPPIKITLPFVGPVVASVAVIVVGLCVV